MALRTLSIVMPAYNEERFIATLIERIEAVDLAPSGFTAELIVVDDCSRDRTAAIVEGLPRVRLVRQPKNGGKGSAVRAGIAVATGEYLLIQDADLEYDPRDYPAMLAEITSGRAEIVYGSRYLATGRHAQQSLSAYLGGRSLSLVARLLIGQYLTDTVTALKLFPRKLLLDLNARNVRVRAGPRDHREGRRPRLSHRRSADPLLPAQPRGRKKDRPARLVHRDEDVLAMEKAKERAAGLKTGRATR